MADHEQQRRDRLIVRTSVIAILTNLCLVAFKVLVGLLANSIAIVLDAMNNLSDALSSVITILGTKLAGRPPDKKHPFGYGRVEYLTAILIACLILIAGASFAVTSVQKARASSASASASSARGLCGASVTIFENCGATRAR